MNPRQVAKTYQTILYFNSLANAIYRHKYAGTAKNKVVEGFNWVKGKGAEIIGNLKNKAPQAPQA